MAESTDTRKEVQGRDPTLLPLDRPEKLPRPFHLRTFVRPTDITNWVVFGLDNFVFIEVAGFEGREAIPHVVMPGRIIHPCFLGQLFVKGLYARNVGNRKDGVDIDMNLFSCEVQLPLRSRKLFRMKQK